MAADLHILTGAPGVGKTTVLQSLAGQIRVVPEPARQVLAEYRASGEPLGTQIPPAPFVDLLLQRSIRQYHSAVYSGGPHLFDRGLPDCVAYALYLGTDPDPSLEAATRYRYNSDVLMLEPWEAIYSTDEERTMSFAMTLRFHEALCSAFARTGYDVTSVPNASVEERAAFVAGHLGV